jgi:hypothetical protein
MHSHDFFLVLKVKRFIRAMVVKFYVEILIYQNVLINFTYIHALSAKGQHRHLRYYIEMPIFYKNYCYEEYRRRASW